MVAGLERGPSSTVRIRSGDTIEKYSCHTMHHFCLNREVISAAFGKTCITLYRPSAGIPVIDNLYEGVLGRHVVYYSVLPS